VQFAEHQHRQMYDDPESLVRDAQAGDAAAFERLIATQYRFIYATAYRWLGHKSDAEDVTQSVCMRLPEALASFDGRAKFTSWLYRITLNAVRDLQRTHQRRGRQINDVAAVSSDEREPTQEDQLRVNDIWRIVRQLPEKQRDAVLLVFGEEMSQAEAAAIMGCKEVTVSWHIHNARKALRDRL
jgi:RNA polymerase sigma-70 factor (ECF subfamily)